MSTEEGIAALRAEVAALGRRLSCLTGRVTVMNNRLKDQDGLITAVHAFKLGMGDWRTHGPR
jgi:hypothetical protein